MVRNFLKCLVLMRFFTLANWLCVCGYVCMLGYIGIHFQCSGSWHVCLAHHSLEAQDSNSARGNYLEMSHVLPGYTHTTVYVHILLNPQQYVRAFQSTLWASSFQTLLANFVWTFICINQYHNLWQLWC